MAKDWQELTRITRGAPVVIERVRIDEKDIVVEGSFELPPLARLTMEDQ
ncbi:RNA polymerase subunit sigma-70, partial [candidate division WOR-1 bacterium DG_54_3]